MKSTYFLEVQPFLIRDSASEAVVDSSPSGAESFCAASHYVVLPSLQHEILAAV